MISKLVRQAKRLVLAGVIVSTGLWAMPIQAQVSDAQVGRLVEALRRAAQQRAPGNNGLVSEWQILPGNIPRWSKLCTGQELTVRQFEENTAQAREILVCVVRDVLRDEYKASGNNEALAVQRAAAWWMTGDPNQYNSGSTAAYTQNVLSFYQQQSPKPQTQQPATPAKPVSSQPSSPPAPAPSATKPTINASSSAQVSNSQVGRLVEALRQAAPETDKPDDELYGVWQVKAENIPRWSQQCIGRELTPTQFATSPVTARAIIVCIMRDVLSEQYQASNKNESLAIQRAAAWWMTGDPDQYNSGSTAAYTQRVLALYRQPEFKFFSHQ
jgi:hypothetical protein